VVPDQVQNLGEIRNFLIFSQNMTCW